MKDPVHAPLAVGIRMINPDVGPALHRARLRCHLENTGEHQGRFSPKSIGGGGGKIGHVSLKAQLLKKMHLDATLKYLCKI